MAKCGMEQAVYILIYFTNVSMFGSPLVCVYSHRTANAGLNSGRTFNVQHRHLGLKRLCCQIDSIIDPILDHLMTKIVCIGVSSAFLFPKQKVPDFPFYIFSKSYDMNKPSISISTY